MTLYIVCFEFVTLKVIISCTEFPVGDWGFVQMHARVSDCGNGEGYCACGFVARDSGDVVSIDMCSGQLPPGQADVTFPGNFISDDVKIYESKGGQLLTVRQNKNCQLFSHSRENSL